MKKIIAAFMTTAILLTAFAGCGKEKAAEKATGRTEAKGGIHGKLEKAKAEIKAKGTDTIPKNRAKDLASVL